MGLLPDLPHPTVLKYYLYRSTTNIGFTMPIFVLFVQDRGLSLAQVGILESVWMVSILVSEIPTGYVADRLGQRNSLLIGTAIATVAAVAFGLSSSFAAFVVIRVFWAFGTTFRSGSTEAWLYDTLKLQFDEEQFAHVQGRGTSVSLLVMAATAGAGGFIADNFGFTPAFFALAAMLVFGFVVLLSFPTLKSQREAAGEEEPDDDEFTVFNAAALIREKAGDARIRWFVLYAVLLLITIQTVQIWTQPVSVDVGLAVDQIGVMYTGFALLSAGAAFYVGWVKERVTIRTWFAVAPFVVGVLFVGVQLLPIAVVAVFYVMRAVRSISQPLMFQYLNDRIESVGRATVLSAVNLTAAVVAIPMFWASGVVGDLTNALTAIVAVGWVLLVGALLLQGWRVLSKIPVHEQVEAEPAD